jgi:hypothetical protein
MSLQWHRPDYVQPPEADAGPAVNGIEYIARENQQRGAGCLACKILPGK